MLGEDVIPLESDTERDDDDKDGEEAHPADELILQKARDRQMSRTGTPELAREEAQQPVAQSGEPGAERPTKRRKTSSADIALHITDAEEEGKETGGDSGGSDSVHSLSDSEAEPAAAKAFKPPVGVTLIGDDEELVQMGMQRAMRQPRYFNGGSFESAKKCFNCGQHGHYSRDCPNEGKQRPCYLCARFGHDEYNCPAKNKRCYYCNRLGHMARDCPHSNTQEIIPMVCMRCGQAECPASGMPDWVRAEGGCKLPYLEEDVRMSRCLTCGAAGHCICAKTTAPAFSPSCHNCGRAGHSGEECPEPLTLAARRERLEVNNRRGLETVGTPLSGSTAKHRRRQSDPGRQSYWQDSISQSRWQGGEYSQTPEYSGPGSDGGYSRQQNPPIQGLAAGYSDQHSWGSDQRGYRAVYPGSGGRQPPPYASYSAYSTPEGVPFPRNRKR